MNKGSFNDQDPFIEILSHLKLSTPSNELKNRIFPSNQPRTEETSIPRSLKIPWASVAAMLFVVLIVPFFLQVSKSPSRISIKGAVFNKIGNSVFINDEPLPDNRWTIFKRRCLK
jgi:hypothetical protein